MNPSTETTHSLGANFIPVEWGRIAAVCECGWSFTADDEVDAHWRWSEHVARTAVELALDVADDRERRRQMATRKYPFSGTCCYCLRERDDLFYHEEDDALYCADVWRCEARVRIIAERSLVAERDAPSPLPPSAPSVGVFPDTEGEQR